MQLSIHGADADAHSIDTRGDAMFIPLHDHACPATPPLFHMSITKQSCMRLTLVAPAVNTNLTRSIDIRGDAMSNMAASGRLIAGGSALWSNDPNAPPRPSQVSDLECVTHPAS
jgi:hypothetical protein